MTATVEHIHIARHHGGPVESLDEVVVVTGKGLEGDRNFGSTRQVTLVCDGELAEAAADLGIDTIAPGATRRNLTLSLPQLPRESGTRLRLGEVELEVWRDCAPCEVMEESVGEGAREALKQRAGVSARVIVGGLLAVGDPVEVLSQR